jgi:hypothetical protein
VRFPRWRWQGRIDAVIAVGLLCALAGGVAYLVGMLVDARATMTGYLVAYVWLVSIAFGALFFLLLVHIVKAGWPVLLRGLLEAIGATFPLLALLFIPIALELARLFPWMTPSLLEEHARKLAHERAAYLSPGFFIARAVLYFLVAIPVAELLRGWSIAQENDPAFVAAPRQRMLSAGAMSLVVLAVTFAAYDWIMSVDPVWYSAVLGLYYLASGLLGMMAFVILAAAGARDLPLGRSHWYALGRCLLTFTLVWGYLAYFQFMLTWIADLPDEVSWFLARDQPGWRWMTYVAIVILHFGVGVLVLLPRAAKRSRRWLVGVALGQLVLQYLDILWCIEPSLYPGGFWLGWRQPLITVGMAGAVVAFGGWRLRGLSIPARHDPLYSRALAYFSR